MPTRTSRTATSPTQTANPKPSRSPTTASSKNLEEPAAGSTPNRGKRSLVQEVPHAGEHHSESEPVCSRDHIWIAQRAAWLDHCRRTGFGRFFDPIREREERVGSYHGTGQRRLRLHHREFYGIDAAHLACAHAQRRAILRKYDGIGLHVLRHFPGEAHRVHLRGRGHAPCHRAQIVVPKFPEVRLLH